MTQGGHRPQPPASAVAGDEWPPSSYSGREQQGARIEPLQNPGPDLRPRSSRISTYVHPATLAKDAKMKQPNSCRAKCARCHEKTSDLYNELRKRLSALSCQGGEKRTHKNRS